MKTDRLVELFHEMLPQGHDPAETAAALIRRVAGTYALELVQTGEIPFTFIDEVLTDLEEELLEIYRKKTYGHFTLQSYRTSLNREPKS